LIAVRPGRPFGLQPSESQSGTKDKEALSSSSAKCKLPD
jgi:hypothetical protein